MLKELICPFSKGKKNCLSVEEIELEKRVGGGGSVWGRSGRVTVERNEGEVFFFGLFWRVTVQQNQCILGNVVGGGTRGQVVCVAEKVGYHYIETTKRKGKGSWQYDTVN